MAKRVKNGVFLIREPRNANEDPILFPYTEKVARLPEYRPYHGPLKEADGSDVSVDTLRAYLRGEVRKGAPAFDLNPETFDIGKASKGMLVDFAERNYGKTLDLSKDIDDLRAEVAALASEAGDADETVSAATTGRENRLRNGNNRRKPDNYPKPDDDAAAVARAQQLAASKSGVNIPTL